MNYEELAKEIAEGIRKIVCLDTPPGFDVEGFLAKTLKEIYEKKDSALREALPWLERGEKFYKFQKAGREFFPNREEAEGCTARVRAALGGGAGKGEGR